MNPAGGKKYLVINADDFGMSASVNRAVALAHDSGPLASASIMANGEAFEEAAGLAWERKGLSVGLHLSLCGSRAVLKNTELPDITDREGFFAKSPASAWIRYSRPEAQEQLEMEIEAQFEKAASAGIRLSHIDGHHHLHMHPAVFRIVCRQAMLRGIRWVRIPNEGIGLVLASARRLISLAEWLVFRFYGSFNKAAAVKAGLNTADRVFGLSATGRIDRKYLLALLPGVKGVTEFFTHPDDRTETGLRELEAIVSGEFMKKITDSGLITTGYSLLPEGQLIA